MAYWRKVGQLSYVLHDQTDYEKKTKTHGLRGLGNMEMMTADFIKSTIKSKRSV